MKILKKLISAVLASTMVVGMSIGAFAENMNPTIPEFSSLEERALAQDDSDVFIIRENNSKSNRTKRSTGRYFKYVKSDKRPIHYNNKRLGWHPDFDDYLEVDEYLFSNSKTLDMSVSLGYGPFSISVASAGGSSCTIYVDANRESRPWVRADVDIDFYDVEMYDSMTGKLLYVNSNGYKDAKFSDIEYKVDYR